MQIRLGPLPAVLLFYLFASVQAANFTFNYGNAPSCGPFQISWSGGSPPFQLALLPAFGSQRLVNIPASSFQNGQGSFSTPLPFAPTKKFVAVLSDSSGFGSGGATSVLTVGAAAKGAAACNTTDPGVDFFFELNTALNQCRPFTFSGYDAAVQPVTITGIIPGGTSFVLNPPTGPTSFDWVANVEAGTSILWMLTDSQGRLGGSSDIKLVGSTDDSTCLTANSPASSSAFPSHTAPPRPSKSASNTASPTASESAATSATPVPAKSNVGLIAGLAIVGVFGLTAIILVVIFLRKRKNQRRYAGHVDLMDPPPGPQDDHPPAPVNPYPFTMSSHGSSYAGSVAYGNQPPSSSAHNLLFEHGSEPNTPMPNPFSDYGDTTSIADTRSAYTGYQDEPTSYAPSASGAPQSVRSYPPSTVTGSAAGRKAALAGAQPYKPARFILHTDLEEVVPPDEGEEVIELPPQYSEARAPISGLQASASSTVPAPPAPSGSSPDAPANVPDISLTPATPAESRPQSQHVLR